MKRCPDWSGTSHRHYNSTGYTSCAVSHIRMTSLWPLICTSSSLRLFHQTPNPPALWRSPLCSLCLWVCFHFLRLFLFRNFWPVPRSLHCPPASKSWIFEGSAGQTSFHTLLGKNYSLEALSSLLKGPIKEVSLWIVWWGIKPDARSRLKESAGTKVRICITQEVGW